MIFLLACGCSCSGAKEETPSSADPSEEVKPVEGARFWVTTADKSKLFAESSIAFGKPSTMSPNVVKFTDETFQSVDGFGAAVTISSCYNILKMGKDARTRFLRQVFDPRTGAGVSLIRICIGGSDFSIDRFTWCDEEGLEHFAPHQMDVKYVLPVLKEIFEINPDVKIIGSPWTAPRWMKLDANLDNPDADIAEMARELGLSYSSLYAKIKALTGETPKAYVTSYRMNIARELLLQGWNVSETADKVGSSSPSTFSREFKSHFGYPPSQVKSS